MTDAIKPHRRKVGRPRRTFTAHVRSFLLEDHQWDRVTDHADRLDVSSSTIIRAALDAHLVKLDAAREESGAA